MTRKAPSHSPPQSRLMNSPGAFVADREGGHLDTRTYRGCAIAGRHVLLALPAACNAGATLSRLP